MSDTCNLSRRFVQVMMDRKEEGGKPSAVVAVASARGEREAHLIGFPFLLLDTLLVDGRCSPAVVLDVTKKSSDTFPPLRLYRRN